MSFDYFHVTKHPDIFYANSGISSCHQLLTPGYKCHTKYGPNTYLNTTEDTIPNNKGACGLFGTSYGCHTKYNKTKMRACLKDYNDGGTRTPLDKNNPDCHPVIWKYKTSDPQYHSTRSTFLENELRQNPTTDVYSIHPFLRTWVDKYGGKNMAHGVFKRYCDRDNVGDYKSCDPWCMKYPTECNKTAMTYCNRNMDSMVSQGNLNKNPYFYHCKRISEIKQASNKEESARHKFLSKEQNYYKNMGDKAFEDPVISKIVLSTSEHPNNPHSVSLEYDEMYRNYCNKVKSNPNATREQKILCSCFLSQDEIDKYGYASRPDCLNAHCATMGEAYRPYKTVRTSYPSCYTSGMNVDSQSQCIESSCPNVCVQQIKANANVSIIENIQFIQNCFDKDVKVRSIVSKELNKSVSDTLIYYKIACIYTDLAIKYSTDEDLERDKALINIQLHQGIRDDMNLYIDKYSFLLPADTSVLSKAKDTCTSIISKVNNHLNDLHGIDWGNKDSLADDLIDRYNAIKTNVLNEAAPLKELTENMIEGTIISMKPKIKEYEDNRIAIKNEANIAFDKFISDNPEFIDDTIEYNLMLFDLDTLAESGHTISYMEGKLTELKAKITEYNYKKAEANKEVGEDPLIEIEKIETSIKESIFKVNNILIELDDIEHPDNQQYRDRWNVLQDKINNRTAGDTTIEPLINDFSSEVQGFIAMKKGEETTYNKETNKITKTLPAEEDTEEKKDDTIKYESIDESKASADKPWSIWMILIMILVSFGSGAIIIIILVYVFGISIFGKKEENKVDNNI
jgi:hypothetical protein